MGGDDRRELELCGVDPRTRGTRTDEALRLLRAFLTGEEVTSTAGSSPSRRPPSGRRRSRPCPSSSAGARMPRRSARGGWGRGGSVSGSHRGASENVAAGGGRGRRGGAPAAAMAAHAPALGGHRRNQAGGRRAREARNGPGVRAGVRAVRPLHAVRGRGRPCGGARALPGGWDVAASTSFQRPPASRSPSTRSPGSRRSCPMH